MCMAKAVRFHEVSQNTFGKGYSEEYAEHKSRHWLLFMRRHASARQKIAFYLVGAPILADQVFIREARRGNLRAVRGLIQGLLRQRK